MKHQLAGLPGSLRRLMVSLPTSAKSHSQCLVPLYVGGPGSSLSLLKAE